jgi:hypothetical protein
MYGLILPGDVVAAGAKWANLSAATGKKSMILNAIVYNRLALLLPPLMFGGVAFAFEDPFGSQFSRLMVYVFIVLILTGSFVIYHPKLGSFIDKAILFVAGFLPGFISSRVAMMITSLQTFRALPLLKHFSILSLSFSIAIISVLTFVFASMAIKLNIPILILAWVIAILKITRLFPLTISNLGIREGVLVVILGLYSVAPESAIALGIIHFTGSLLISVIGLAYQFALTMGWAQWEKTYADKLEES